MVSDDSVTLRIDPHVHSEGSYDAHDPIELLLEQAADIGLDGIVITDHNVIDQSLKAAKMADDYGLIGIPGAEISTKHGHVLAVGVEELPPIGAPLGETVDAIRELGGVAIVAHPFQWTRHGARKKRITDCDAIEVYNSWLFTGYKNRKAGQFAHRNGYPPIGSSDAHSVPQVGRAYTEITILPTEVDSSTISKQDIERDIILQAIRDGSTTIQGKRKPIHDSAVDYSKGAVRKSGHYARTGLAALLNTFSSVIS